MVIGKNFKNTGHQSVDGIQEPMEPVEPVEPGPNKRNSPFYLHQLMKKILEEYRKMDVVKEDGVVGHMLDSLLLTVRLNFPKPFIHGKKCSNCDHRMHCKSIRCPSCYKEMRKRKRQGEENEIEI